MMLRIVMSPYHVVVSYHIYSLTFVVRIVKSVDEKSYTTKQSLI